MPTQPFDTEISLGLLTKATLHGKITGLVVQEKDDSGAFVDTNNIVRTDRDWQIMLTWKLMGTFLDLTPPTMGPITVELRGNFLINAYLEGLGRDADELDLAGDTAGGIPLMGGRKAEVKHGSITKADSTTTPPTPEDPLETEWQYNETITIKGEHPGDPATKTPKVERTLQPGSYKVSVNLTYEQPQTDSAGNPILDSTGKQVFKPGPMAGFMELPNLIQVYDPGTF